ncbi:hypothetical protein Purlil1_1591 [Purpureocillium lilacinum]|uniref:Uncharacterized protein n=1 Tax=Purpureocillium lilacinum TaxID=33203 RepID=A0ABR0CD76_PURLI|nr:hypothetical protein Purlil1_1591 [Purpureocillium lilacinum]
MSAGEAGGALGQQQELVGRKSFRSWSVDSSALSTKTKWRPTTGGHRLSGGQWRSICMVLRKRGRFRLRSGERSSLPSSTPSSAIDPLRLPSVQSPLCRPVENLMATTSRTASPPSAKIPSAAQRWTARGQTATAKLSAQPPHAVWLVPASPDHDDGTQAR